MYNLSSYIVHSGEKAGHWKQKATCPIVSSQKAERNEYLHSHFYLD